MSTFSIVKEDGASIYSCSDLAKAELPDLDLTLRGAGTNSQFAGPLIYYIVQIFEEDFSEKFCIFNAHTKKRIV